MEKEEIFLVDTNIIVYAYEKEECKRKIKSQKILERCFNKEITLAVSNQNLAEFSYVALKKLKLDTDTIKKIVKDISDFSCFKKFNYKRKTILSAVEISNKHNMSFWDSLISATMIENGILNIYTENVKDFKVPTLNVVNPLE